MTIAEASRQHQLAVEALRLNPDDEDALQELEQAQKHLELLWLEHVLS